MSPISHTDVDGTMLEGTARGDGSAEVVKSLGWRWGRSIGSWFVPRSRGVPPKRELIERTAQADERLVARGGAGGNASLDRVHERLAAARADLDYWQQVRAQQLADGTATNYGPSNVRKGDAVKIRGTWRRVVRANPKSVTVETDYSWTGRTPWHEVQDHVRSGASNHPAEGL